MKISKEQLEIFANDYRLNLMNHDKVKIGIAAFLVILFVPLCFILKSKFWGIMFSIIGLLLLIASVKYKNSKRIDITNNIFVGISMGICWSIFATLIAERMWGNAKIVTIIWIIMFIISIIVGAILALIKIKSGKYMTVSSKIMPTSVIVIGVFIVRMLSKTFGGNIVVFSLLMGSYALMLMGVSMGVISLIQYIILKKINN